VTGQNFPLPSNIKELIKSKNLNGIEVSEIQNMLDSDKSPIKNGLDPFEKNNKKIEEVIDLDQKIISDEIEDISDVEDKIVLGDLSDEENDSKDILLDEDVILKNDNYYGYKIFELNPENFQNTTNFAVDPNYIVGYGDEIIVLLWGETESYDEYIVSKDGYIFVKNIGQVFVNGLTLEKVEEKLFKNLQKVFSTLGSNNGISSTYLDVTLGKSSLRPLRIFALGEVGQPGAYNVKSSSSLFTSLYYFDGPTIDGSLRDIKLIRDGKEIASIDFYNYLLSGKQIGDVKIQRGDVIFIPQRGKTIQMKGEIKRPQIFELKENETLEDLINYSGGFLATTYTKRAQIKRVVPPNERKFIGDRILIDIEINNLPRQSKEIELVDGDEITETYNNSTLKMC